MQVQHLQIAHPSILSDPEWIALESIEEETQHFIFDETMLHAAAAAAERQAVAFLVSHGVAVNARDASHRTPLDVAACRLPPDDGAAVLERDEAALRAEFRSLETNAHPHYGGGFRACVRSLRGREIHALLSHVREHARLPPPVV